MQGIKHGNQQSALRMIEAGIGFVYGNIEFVHSIA